MKTDDKRNKLILALGRAVIKTFDKGKWLELGYLTNCKEHIENHPRLLNSLYWSDEDYEGNTFQVLETIIDSSEENIRIIEEYVDLEKWLKRNDQELFYDLYGSTDGVALEEVVKASQHMDISEFERHAKRIRNGLKSDPEQAIGSAKELLETVLKSILEIHEQNVSDDIQSLIKKAIIKLNLSPSFGGNAKERDIIKKVISSISNIIIGVSEIRNLYGTGHGRAGSKEIKDSHTKLIVNSTLSLAIFLLEISKSDN